MEYPLERCATVARPKRPNIAPLAPTVRLLGLQSMAPNEPLITAEK